MFPLLSTPQSRSPCSDGLAIRWLTQYHLTSLGHAQEVAGWFGQVRLMVRSAHNGSWFQLPGVDKKLPRWAPTMSPDLLQEGIVSRIQEGWPCSEDGEQETFPAAEST